RRFLNPEVVESVQAAQRGGDDKVSQQEQAADSGQPPRMQSGGGIDTATVGEMLADPDVIDADQAGQRADGQQVWQRGKTHRREGQADDIGFAGAPVAVEQRRGWHPPDVARAPYGTDFHGAGLGPATTGIHQCSAYQPYQPGASLRCPDLPGGFLNEEAWVERALASSVAGLR